MDKKKLLPTLALAASCSLWPAASQAQESMQMVSNRVMDVLEAWSSPAVSLEDLALDSHPQLIEDYLPAIESHYDGQSLAEVFAHQLPATWQIFSEELVGDPDDGAQLLAFAMALEKEDYRAWQAGLRDSGLDFRKFVQAEHPEIAPELEALNVTPADRGIGLLEYVRSLGDPALLDEVVLYAGPTVRRTCACRIVYSFSETPFLWTQEINENYFSQWGSAPQKMRTINYGVAARGAARNIDFYRVSEHNLWAESRDKNTNSSTLRLRMLCTIGAEQPCVDPVCAGQVAMRIGYASRVYEKHDVGGTWNKNAEALTADYAKLTYSGPANLGPTLFEKGVAVAGEYQSGWNAGAVANVLYSAGQVALSIATSNFSNALDADLVDTMVDGIAGLVTHSGSTGSVQRDMMAAWDNSTNMSQMILLQPNQTHLFDLTAASKIYSRGYGKWSWTWGNLDSANYFVGVARHFQCGPDVTAPPQQAFWLQAGSDGAPYDAATLQNLVGSFIQVELGSTVPQSTLSATVGHYP